MLNNLLEQQPAFHRLVKHVELKPLNDDSSQYVILACLNKAEIKTEIHDNAQKLLLNIAGGYPYSLHKLGHEAFNAMTNGYLKRPSFFEIESEDVIIGLKNMLIDFASRFEQILQSLTDDERETLHMLINEWEQNLPNSYLHLVGNLPAIFTQKILFEKIKLSSEVIDSLCEKQILTPIKKMLPLNTRSRYSI